MTRQLHLNPFIHSRGHHEPSWRHPASPSLALTDIRYYQDLGQRAEAALFDSIFLADQLALGDDAAQAARTWLEPVTVLAAVPAPPPFLSMNLMPADSKSVLDNFKSSAARLAQFSFELTLTAILLFLS